LAGAEPPAMTSTAWYYPVKSGRYLVSLSGLVSSSLRLRSYADEVLAQPIISADA